MKGAQTPGHLMLQNSVDELDALIEEEKKRVAQEYFQDAWSSAVQEGIEPAILAESAIFAIMRQLGETEGDAAVSELIDALPDLQECGQFLTDKKLQ